MKIASTDSDATFQMLQSPWMRPSGPWMYYRITASMKTTLGTVRSHIPQGTFYDANKIFILHFNMRPIGLFSNQSI